MIYDYSLSHVREVAGRVLDGNLSAPARFFSTPGRILMEIYNGIGPDCWNPRFREKVTELLKWFEPEALVHDWEYTFQPKTYAHFTIANLRFAVNAFIAAYEQAAAAITTRRARWRYIMKQTGRGLLLALLCQLGGWHGYKNTTPPKENNGAVI